MVDSLFGSVRNTVQEVTASKTPLPLTRCLLDEALEQRSTWHRIEQHSEATIRGDKLAIKDLRASAGNPAFIDEITRPIVMKWMLDQRDRGNADQTIKTRFVAARAFFNWAVEWDLIPSSPFKGLKAPRVVRSRKPSPKAAHINAMLALCPPASFMGSRRRAMLMLLITVGIRLGDLARLQRADVDFTAGTITLRKPKNRKEIRVPLHREAQRALHRWTAHHKADGPLWVSRSGTPLTQWGVSEDIARLRMHAGLSAKDLPSAVHAWRRRFAEKWVEQHRERWAGTVIGNWSSPHMLDYYTRGLEDEQHAAEEYREGFDPFG